MRAVLLPTTCSSVDRQCEDEHVSGVTGIVRSELEFAGYSLLDAEKLVLDARTREDVDVELSRFGERVASVKSRVQAGAIFEDLSPSQRRALLAEAEAQGTVVVSVQIGTEQGTLRMRSNAVQIRAGLADGGDLAWVSRCEATSSYNNNPGIDQAIETATRCALDAVLGRQ
jgi:hypothetical protein